MNIMLKILGILIVSFSIQGLTKTVKKETAIFAGGCFWCIEAAFDDYKGVFKAESGYIGGQASMAKYKQVSAGGTKHIEAVQIEFDPDKVSYKELLEFFWRQIDPTDKNGQFVDRGTQYTTGVFYLSEDQKKIADASKNKLGASGRFKKTIVTPIIKATAFYLAEDYHQDYHIKNKIAYKYYRFRSGRDQFLKKFWKDTKMNKDNILKKITAKFEKPDLNKLKALLTPMQFKVTQKGGTEPPFKNEYWDNKKPGIYVDVVSGEPLFSSTDKFKSGTGWPSFTKPIKKDQVVEKDDISLFSKRTEVKSKDADSHLGHVFTDGPKESTGLRYCINSASMKFVPVSELKAQGYEEYVKLFEQSK